MVASGATPTAHMISMTAYPKTAGASEYLLGVFVHPPTQSRIKAWAIVASLVIPIGIVDYLTGISISLSILYLIPVSLAAAWLGAHAGAIVAVLCSLSRATGDVASLSWGSLPMDEIWNVSAALVVFLFVIWLLRSLIGFHHRLEGKIEAQTDELRESAADRRRLEREILDIAARERSAFGRELHDDLGQHFVATALAAQTLTEKLGESALAREAHAIVLWIEEGIAKSRKLARGLLQARIAPERFPQELEELASAASRGSVECRLIHEGGEIEADSNRCAQLYRIAQEAVSNALRHASPRTIRITLACNEDALSLTVGDDGCGITAGPPASAGLGLRIMNHRARIIGASLAVRSSPGGGTEVVCRLPQNEFISL